MAYNPEVHHRRSIRLPSYDYRQAGAYSVTVCTHERLSLFDDARLRDIAEWTWRRVVVRARGRIEDVLVVMPNHVHGVVWISGRDTAPGTPVGAQHPGAQSATQKRDVTFAAGLTCRCRRVLRPYVPVGNNRQLPPNLSARSCGRSSPRQPGGSTPCAARRAHRCGSGIITSE